MRSKLGFIVLGLGLFLLFLGLLSRFYVYPKVAVVPLDQQSMLPTAAIPDPENGPSVSEAYDANILSIADGGENITTDLTSTRNTLGLVKPAEDLNEETGENLAIYDTFSFNTRPDEATGEPVVLSGTFDRVTFDRHTGEVYHCAEDIAEMCDEKTASVKTDTEATDVNGVYDDLDFIAPGEAGDEGFQGFDGYYFKLPFNTQTDGDYKWWDGDLLEATSLKFEKEDKVDGLDTYKFVQEIPDTKVGELEIPASIAGIDQEGNILTDSMYSNTRTLWIEPETGVLIKGTEDQYSYLAYNGEEVVVTTDAEIGYTEETIAENADTYKDLSMQLKAVRVWVPLVGLILGLILVGVGLFMVLRKGGGSDDGGAPSEDRTLANAS